jgi:hypothetical protein
LRVDDVAGNIWRALLPGELRTLGNSDLMVGGGIFFIEKNLGYLN